MEEILKKDIFNDETLQKLSPDFTPSDLILRMQMRRSLVKDTHCYRVHKYYNMQKNARVKNGLKIGKELLKIKNEFENENLKNDMQLKNGKLNGRIKERRGKKAKTKTIKVEEEDENNLPDVVANSWSRHSEDNGMIDEVDYDVVTEIQNIAVAITPECEKDVSFEDYSSYTVKSKHKNTDSDIVDIFSDIKRYSPKGQISNVFEHKNKQNTPRNEDMVGDLQTLFTKLAITSCSSEDDNEKSPKNLVTAVKDDHLDKNVKKLEVNLKLQLSDDDCDCCELNFLNITKIKPKISIRDEYLMRKYARKWKLYVNKKHEELNMKREAVLNNFFNKLENKKNREDVPNKSVMLAKDYSSYQHRYKVQKHIIAFQKAKLEEQNRLIEELKYNKILEASKISVDAMKQEVRKTYFEIDRNLKPKIKCLTNDLKIAEIEEPALILHCLKVPQFLQRMEKRAREREEKHALIRERRRQIEEEKIRMKQQAELAKAEMDKEEKAQRMKELKEKRKKEKIEAIRKKEYAEKMRALNVMADLHYEKTLLTKYGLAPWKMLIEIKRNNIERAKKLRRIQLMRRVFLHWMWYTDDQVIERNFIATEFYRKKILKKYFEGFKKNLNELKLKKQVAEDFYDLYVTKLVFRKFREATAVAKAESERKFEIAIAFYNSNLKFKTFTCWRTLPAINKLLREQDSRKARWRQKVLEVVPDFVPPEE